MSEFCPFQWPEEEAPEHLRDCTDCGLYKQGSRMVWGEGNPNAPIMIILDNPGARENREGNPFVCGTRETLQLAANKTGFTTEDLYTTYILKRRPVRTYDKEKARTACMQHLYQQIREKEPKLIFCLGNISVQSFFEDSTVDVKSLRGTVHEVQGYKTVVAYHPLAVRRRPNLWPLFLEDWKLLNKQYQEL